MSQLREIAYRIDSVLWVREVLGVTPTEWQQTFLRSPRGASILVLTARQIGKTTTAAWAIAHAMVFIPGSLSVIGCPAQRQSSEALRKVHRTLLKAGAEFKNAAAHTSRTYEWISGAGAAGQRRFNPRPDGGRLYRGG